MLIRKTTDSFTLESVSRIDCLSQNLSTDYKIVKLFQNFQSQKVIFRELMIVTSIHFKI